MERGVYSWMDGEIHGLMDVLVMVMEDGWMDEERWMDRWVDGWWLVE